MDLHLFSVTPFSRPLSSVLSFIAENEKFGEQRLARPSMMQACKALKIVAPNSFDLRSFTIQVERARLMRNSMYILIKPWPSTLRIRGGRMKLGSDPNATGKKITVGKWKRLKSLLENEI
jgi:hypothetical protein